MYNEEELEYYLTEFEKLLDDIDAKEAENEFRNGEFVFAKGVSRSLDDQITRLNNNVLIVGASGCGKVQAL